ncbi:hypothetical protein LZ32DRAFT_378730 [Colletotrichum eremochloae]|nr:hypothetical protein LZ32DRAFT_378730 [Colletotrichum eremochloae]
MSWPSLLLLLDTIMCIPLSLLIDVRHLARDILVRSANSNSPYLLLLLAFILPVTWILVKDTNIPLANKPKWFQTRIGKQFAFLSNGQDTFQHYKSAYPGRRFRLLTDKGELVVLPQSYAATIRNESSLDFGVSVSTASDMPLEPIRLWSKIYRTFIAICPAFSLFVSRTLALVSCKPL